MIKYSRIKKSKYHAIPTVVDGITFDSRKEASRWQELKLLQRAGKISRLERQVDYLLIPAQYEGDSSGKKHCVERACRYVADFVYLEGEKLVVEDCKGQRTRDYIIKRKLMLKQYGIKIKET